MIGAFQDNGRQRDVLEHPDCCSTTRTSTRTGTSIELSLVTAGLGALLGVMIAYAAIRDGTPRFVRATLTTFAGVAANFGGIPLAFAFIATLGPLGVVTNWFRSAGYDLYAARLRSSISMRGIELVYLYFQLPLMILVIAPALDGLKREWREAASNLGAHGLAVLALRRHPGADAVVPRRLHPALRQRLRRLRDRLQPEQRQSTSSRS